MSERCRYQLYDVKHSFGDVNLKKMCCELCIDQNNYDDPHLDRLQCLLNMHIIRETILHPQGGDNTTSDLHNLKGVMDTIKDLIEIEPKLWHKYIKRVGDRNEKRFIKGLPKGVQPVSRSYYKMNHILNTFSDVFKTHSRLNASRFHLCEAPGGFIQSCNAYFENTNYHTISIHSQHSSVPSFPLSQKENPLGVAPLGHTGHTSNKNHLSRISEQLPTKFTVDTARNVSIKNGDITDFDVINQLISTPLRAKYSSDIITADGGVHVTDYSNQEGLSIKLIGCETYIALHLLNRHGTFIIKVFETFTQRSIDLLNIITNLFENTYIYKPLSSRVTNSEKYIVATNFARPTDLWRSTNYILSDVIFTNPLLKVSPRRGPSILPNDYSYNISVINNVMAYQQGKQIMMSIQNIRNL